MLLCCCCKLAGCPGTQETHPRTLYGELMIHGTAACVWPAVLVSGMATPVQRPVQLPTIAPKGGGTSLHAYTGVWFNTA